jgi:hypothetical protein
MAVLRLFLASVPGFQRWSAVSENHPDTFLTLTPFSPRISLEICTSVHSPFAQFKQHA